MDLEIPSTLGNSELPLTSIDLALPSTFNLLPTSEFEYQKVKIVKESLSQDLKQKRQEVLWFHGGEVVAIPIVKDRVMYIKN